MLFIWPSRNVYIQYEDNKCKKDDKIIKMIKCEELSKIKISKWENVGLKLIEWRMKFGFNYYHMGENLVANVMEMWSICLQQISLDQIL